MPRFLELLTEKTLPSAVAETARLAEVFEQFTYPDWVGFIEALARDDVQVAEAIDAPSGEPPIHQAIDLLADVSDRTARQMSAAAAELLGRYDSRSALEVLRLVHLAHVLELDVNWSALERIARDRRVDRDARARAALLLADRHPPPADFWFATDFARQPVFYPAAVLGLARVDTSRLAEFLDAMDNRAEIEFEYLLRPAVRRVGAERLAEHLRGASGWVRLRLAQYQWQDAELRHVMRLLARRHDGRAVAARPVESGRLGSGAWLAVGGFHACGLRPNVKDQVEEALDDSETSLERRRPDDD